MTPLAGDDRGNLLLGLSFPAEADVEDVACSLVVVRLDLDVLLVFDRWRRRWEIPGGTRDPGESAREAAVRELAEETGITGQVLEFGALAEFSLTDPPRHELGAIYATTPHRLPRLLPNPEIADFHWWRPGTPLAGLSPIDAVLAVRIGVVGA